MDWGCESFALRLAKQLVFVTAFATALRIKLRLFNLFEEFGVEDG